MTATPIGALIEQSDAIEDAPYYQDDHVTVHLGDCLDVLADLPDASVDAVVTDPPYGLDFMGKHWDTGAVAFDTAIWGHCLRLLKPGGHLLAFGGTRTWHRLAVAVEDAGFEIRDSIAWLYGSGFPKSLDVSKAIDKAAGAEREVVGVHYRNGGGSPNSGSMSGPLGTDSELPLTAPATDAAKQWQGWGTALKPSFEPVVVARKPFKGTVAANVLTHGTGALNIDATRVGTTKAVPASPRRAPQGPAYGDLGKDPGTGTGWDVNVGRWPTNVVIDEHTAEGIDQQSGNRRAGERPAAAGIKSAPGANGTMGGGWSGSAQAAREVLDAGGASRFFPTFRYEAKAPTAERPSANGVAHPTVKPLDLMRWLIRLVTPPHGLVLDPFAGSGTTAEACIHEHMRCITIEREVEYLPLIVARLAKPMAIGFDFGEDS